MRVRWAGGIVVVAANLTYLPGCCEFCYPQGHDYIVARHELHADIPREVLPLGLHASGSVPTRCTPDDEPFYATETDPFSILNIGGFPFVVLPYGAESPLDGPKSPTARLFPSIPEGPEPVSSSSGSFVLFPEESASFTYQVELSCERQGTTTLPPASFEVHAGVELWPCWLDRGGPVDDEETLRCTSGFALDIPVILSVIR